MRHEASFLKDILLACRKIEAIVATTDEESFLKNEVLSAAILHHLTVIGEAISRLSDDLMDRHPEVPWRQIISVRNRIVHAYFIWIGKYSGMLPPTTSLNCGGKSSPSSQLISLNPNPAVCPSSDLRPSEYSKLKANKLMV